MDNQWFDICHVCQKREDFKAVDKAERLFLPSFDFKGEDRTSSFREVSLIKGMVGMVGQWRMIDPFNLWMVLQELNHLQCVFDVPFHTQGEGFQTLQQNECVERADGCPGVTEQDGADADGISCCSGSIDKAHAMITEVRFSQLREFAGCFPVKLAGVNDDTAQWRSVASDELRCRMDYDVRTVFNRTD